MMAQHTDILRFLEEFRNGVLLVPSVGTHVNANRLRTYARHELEDGRLSIPEQTHNLLKTFEHGVIVSDSTSHPPSQAVPEIVVDVQLARGPGS